MNRGDRIGRYVIEKLLGQGATGVVCLAVDPLIDRRVALKTLRSDLEQTHAEEMQQRFLREARAAGRLSHPNITTVYDVGRDAASRSVFIAMEFVTGSTLASEIAASPRFELRRAVELAATLAEALAYAHREGVVHRDLKPANILMTSSGVPKITDFGIARLDASTLTVEGSVLGTPYYMSPEQVGGQRVDGRSDLYSLGVVLFEMLSGAPPYAGASLMTMLRAIISEPPPDLSALRPDLPAELIRVIVTALNKDPAARFQSGDELAAALRATQLSPPREDEPAATVIGVKLDAMSAVAGTLQFATSSRRVHLRCRPELIVGRDPSADILLSDAKVSRRHAMLSLDDHTLRLADLASSNGSTVNGSPVTAPVSLEDGDVVGFGGTVHFLVRYRRRQHPPLSAALISGADEYLVCRGEVALGSDPQRVDVRIADPQVAAVHAWISPAPGAPRLRSGGLQSVLFVNGEPTSGTHLLDRSSVQIGATRMLWLDRSLSTPVTGPTRF